MDLERRIEELEETIERLNQVNADIGQDMEVHAELNEKLEKRSERALVIIEMLADYLKVL